jgi:hypothetical protein
MIRQVGFHRPLIMIFFVALQSDNNAGVERDNSVFYASPGATGTECRDCTLTAPGHVVEIAGASHTSGTGQGRELKISR